MIPKTILITGGAGFIGVNAADYFCRNGWSVSVVDNLVRRGTDSNLKWLKSRQEINFAKADIRDAGKMVELINRTKPQVVLHLAAQVAVTTSVQNPREDFEINALGTLNLLEAIRSTSPETFFINASTNKVYGKLNDVTIVEEDQRYRFKTPPNGVSEKQPLDFYSPYGCSKGVADLYTIDYARIYDLKTVSLRQSCIYGPRQFGVEDQGWVAWFIIANVLHHPITIFGNGKQTRDLLHVDDLVQCYDAAIERQDLISGEVFNIGGGVENALSLKELLKHLSGKLDADIQPEWDNERPGDQPIFVCDIRESEKRLAWRPKISVEQGVGRLIDWVADNKSIFQIS